MKGRKTVDKMPPALGRSILVLEVDTDREHPRKWVRVTMSKPGAESTMTRTWAITGGRMEDRTFEDLQVWLLQALLAAIEVIGGAQGTLTLDDLYPPELRERRPAPAP